MKFAMNDTHYEELGIHITDSHAADSIDRNVRIQSPSSLETLLSASAVFSCFHSFLSLSIVYIILMSFLIVET